MLILVAGDTVLMEKITVKELRSKVTYDPENGSFVWMNCDECRPCWNSRFAGKKAFNAPHSNGYLFGAISNQKVFAHRAAWALVYGLWPDGEIDHINHNKKDNRIFNLRLINRSNNAKNLSMSKKNKSGVTGVFKHTQTGIWQAQIRVNKKSIHLGSFNKIEDAVSARQSAEVEYGFHENHGK